VAQLHQVESSTNVPPQNLEAEESVLGAMMISPGAITAVNEILKPDGQEFYRPSHAMIYRAALALHARGEPVDAVMLTDQLEESGELDQVGGRVRLHELAALVPASANAGHYAKIVVETSTLRGFIRAGGELARLGWDRPGEIDDLKARARALLADLDTSAVGSPFRVVTLDDFIGITEDTSPPLIGATSSDALLPAEGLLLMYGDGGAGKTTLSIDALAHIASGTEWLGNAIPAAANVLLIENEGPRGPFREMLDGKKARWQGEPFAPRVRVLEEPWTQFTLDDAGYRAHLAQEIADHEIALVIVGPLASIGAKGTGTPDDVNDFSNFISDLRARAGRPFALWIVHHENKSGDVSGAWERLPDTLVHVSAQGNGKTRVHWRKVRWSSRLHNTSVLLNWDDGGFTIDEAKIRDLPSELIVKFAQVDDRWLTAKQAATLIGANLDKVRDALQQLVIEQKMIFEIGPKGRSGNAKCWRLRTDSDPLSHPESLDLFQGGQEGLTRVTPPYKESPRVESPPPGAPTDSAPPSHPNQNGHHEQPPALNPDELEWADDR
jgi:hypothetical protein